MTSNQLSLLSLLIVFISVAYQASAGEIECGFCEVAAEYLILNPDGAHDVEQLLEKFCSILPSDLKPYCDKGVSALGVLLADLPVFLGRNEEFTNYALCTMVNMCDIDCCISDLPEQVHISYGDDPHTSIYVTWVTREMYPSHVNYGTNSSSLEFTTSGTTKTYTPGYWKGWIHYVLLTNLQPGTKYYYRVGSANTGWSKVFSFTTEHADSKNRIVRILNIGDMGNANSTNNINQMKKLVATEKVDFILHDGDISYADGFQLRWDTYFRTVEDAVANTPYMVTLGNHEIGIIGALNLSIGYVHRFNLPGPYSISNDLENLFYSWDHGNVHFISIDTESVDDIAYVSQKQATWIAQDLSAVDRSKTPWVIVYGHRPFYCSGSSADCTDLSKILRESLEDTFYRYRVNLVIQAHRHMYERLWPTYKGVPELTYNNPRSPVYIVNGAGGNREGFVHITPPYPPNSAFSVSEWGYGILTIYNGTALDYDFYEASTGKLLDHITLTQS